MANYYELLGVGRTATTAEVRQAYLRLAREKHPDLFADPAEKARAQRFFQDLTTAFNTLQNDVSRREYDAEVERPKPVTPAEIAQEAYARGLQMLEAGQLQDAVTALHAAVHHAPNEARYHAVLGRALGRHPPAAREAIQAFERAVQLAPRLRFLPRRARRAVPEAGAAPSRPEGGGAGPAYRSQRAAGPPGRREPRPGLSAGHP